MINEYQAREAERTIDAALDDYHHNSDRRYRLNPLPSDHESLSDHSSVEPSYDEVTRARRTGGR